MRRWIPALLLATSLLGAAPIAEAREPGQGLLMEDLPEPMKRRLLEREARLLERIRELDEDRWRALTDLREAARTDEALRREYLAALERSAQEVRRLERDPDFLERRAEMDALRAEIDGLVVGFADLPEAEQVTRRAEMERLAAELFNLRQAQRRVRIAEMEARLAEMKAAVDKRDAHKDTLIERHLDQLLLGPPDL